MGPSRDRMADWKEEQEAAEKEGVVWLEPRKRKRSRGSRGRCGGGRFCLASAPQKLCTPTYLRATRAGWEKPVSVKSTGLEVQEKDQLFSCPEGHQQGKGRAAAPWVGCAGWAGASLRRHLLLVLAAWRGDPSPSSI